MKRRPPRYPNKLLVIGMAALVVGVALQLWTLGQMRRSILGLWPVAALVAGLVLLYLAWFRGGSPHWLGPGVLLALGGLFFLLVEAVLGWDSLPRVWPAFMMIAGLSLVPYGARLAPRRRAAMVIPGVFIAGLGLLLLPFALAGSRGSLTSFVTRWWPLALIAVGLALVVSFFSTRKPNRKV